MLPSDLALLVVALLIASSSATLLAVFPAAVQSWSRAAFARRPWLRTLTLDCDFAALTDARSTWLLRLYGVVLVPVAALAARAVVVTLTAR